MGAREVPAIGAVVAATAIVEVVRHHAVVHGGPAVISGK